MFEPKILNYTQLEILENTISPNAFYAIVGNALKRGIGLSAVRMADGERALYKWCTKNKPLSDTYNKAWWDRMGIEGIRKDDLKLRLEQAANNCTFFGPSLSGLFDEDFNVYSLFQPRLRYIDGFFPNAWDEDMKIQLFQTAKHVLFIHANAHTADAIQIRAKHVLGVKVTWLKLNNWKVADSVVDEAKTIDAPLVLFSAGPASKWIGPSIAQYGKVTLDIGQAADRWTFSSLISKLPPRPANGY